MRQSIVAGVSFEAQWVPIGRTAAALARAYSADVRLVHAGVSESTLKHGWGDALVKWFAVQDISAQMEWSAETNPAKALQEAVEPRELTAALVVGASNMRTPHPGFLGRTTMQLLRTCELPIAVVPPAAEEPRKDATWQIVFPTDFSDTSLIGLQEVVRIARGLDAMLHVTHAVRTHSREGLWIDEVPPVSSKDQKRLDEAKLGLQRLGASLGADVTTHLVNCASVPHGVIAKAQELDADWIVIPSRGRGVVSSALLGSVAQAIVRIADRPVIVLK